MPILYPSVYCIFRKKIYNRKAGSIGDREILQIGVTEYYCKNRDTMVLLITSIENFGNYLSLFLLGVLRVEASLSCVYSG
jgi:hypothetical protein